MNMTMKLVMIMASVLLGAITAFPALADGTVGDLLAKGAKRLSTGDLKAVIPGTTLRENVEGRGPLEVSFDADGRAYGVVRFANTTPVNGKWRTEEPGRICYSISGTARGGAVVEECWVVLTLGDKLYLTADDQSGTAIAPGTLSKK